jgi:hypothetical protein
VADQGNIYLGGEEITVKLFEVTRHRGSNGRDTAQPTPDFSKVVFSFPPNGPVSVDRGLNLAMTENKSSGAVSTQQKRFDRPIVIHFQIDIDSDDETPETALQQFERLEKLFMGRDEYGVATLYAPGYPLLLNDASNPVVCLFSKFAAHDNNGTDELTVTIELTQQHWSPPIRSGAGAGAADAAKKKPDDRTAEEWNDELELTARLKAYRQELEDQRKALEDQGTKTGAHYVARMQAQLARREKQLREEYAKRRSNNQTLRQQLAGLPGV